MLDINLIRTQPEVVRAALNPLPGPQDGAGAAAALPPAAEAPALSRPTVPPPAEFAVCSSG